MKAGAAQPQRGAATARACTKGPPVGGCSRGSAACGPWRRGGRPPCAAWGPAQRRQRGVQACNERDGGKHTSAGGTQCRRMGRQQRPAASAEVRFVHSSCLAPCASWRRRHLPSPPGTRAAGSGRTLQWVAGMPAVRGHVGGAPAAMAAKVRGGAAAAPAGGGVAAGKAGGSHLRHRRSQGRAPPPPCHPCHWPQAPAAEGQTGGSWRAGQRRVAAAAGGVPSRRAKRDCYFKTRVASLQVLTALPEAGGGRTSKRD